MRNELPEEYRITAGPMASQPGQKEGGFVIPHPVKGEEKMGIVLCVIFSSGYGWEHCSVTAQQIRKARRGRNVKERLEQLQRCPTWEEMSYIKSLFWAEEETAMQLHPPKALHVNNHNFALHIWRPTAEEIPLPNPLMVGIPGVEMDKKGRIIKVEGETAAHNLARVKMLREKPGILGIFKS